MNTEVILIMTPTILMMQAGGKVVAAQRSLFLSPPVEAALLPLPSPPDGVRDIAGRWHGTPSPQWRA